MTALRVTHSAPVPPLRPLGILWKPFATASTHLQRIDAVVGHPRLGPHWSNLLVGLLPTATCMHMYIMPLTDGAFCRLAACLLRSRRGLRPRRNWRSTPPPPPPPVPATHAIGGSYLGQKLAFRTQCQARSNTLVERPRLRLSPNSGPSLLVTTLQPQSHLSLVGTILAPKFVATPLWPHKVTSTPFGAQTVTSTALGPQHRFGPKK